MDHQWVEVPALGRAADLGTLYDLRTDKLIIGKSPWSPEQLKSSVNTVYNSHTKTKILDQSNSVPEQILTVKRDGHLKLNILCNSVPVQGAASYLKDDKYSKGDDRVVLKHETTTQLRSLTMEHLKDTKISHPEILDEGIATHVVVGIQYGGKLFMTFDQKVTENKLSQKVKFDIKAKLKGIISNCSGNVDMSCTTYDTQDTKEIKCEIYSDFRTDENPSDYEEAVQFIKKLPSLTRSIGVPVMLYLCPLDSLGYTVRQKRKKEKRKAIKEISPALIDKACVNIEHLQSVLAECKDLMEENSFPIIKRQLTLFMEKVQEYNAIFLEKISQLKLEITDGSADNYAFGALLEEHESSLFSHSSLTEWLDEKKEKMKALQGIIKSLKSTSFVSSGELESLLYDTNIYHVVCLVFKISSDQDAQLLNMQAFLKKGPVQEFEETSSPLDVTPVREPLDRFVILSDDNQRNNVVKFVAVEEPLNSLDSNEKPGACVRYYFKGKLQVENLMRLEKSQNLRKLDVSSDSVELAWDHSLAELNDIEDKVQYKTVFGQWQTSSVVCKGRRATIQGLKPSTKYTFIVHAPDQIFLRDNSKTLEVETQAGSFPTGFVCSGAVGMLAILGFLVKRFLTG